MKTLIKSFIITLATVATLSSCATTYVSTVRGDITWMNNNGETVRSWDNAKVQSDIEIVSAFGYDRATTRYTFKLGGWLSFEDKEGNDVLINGGMAIIENVSITREEMLKPNVETDEALSLKSVYDTKKKEYDRFSYELNYRGITNENRKKIKESLNNLESELADINAKYYDLTGYTIGYIPKR